MPKIKVGTGESTSSIAQANGFFWETIWNHPENSALRQKRKDPNVLFKDDEIFIPEKTKREVSKATDAEHGFVLKGVPCKLKIRLMKQNQPRAGETYVLDIDGTLTNGTTDGDGNIEVFIPPRARKGRLLFRSGQEVINLSLDGLDPVDTISGVQHRLNNLGFNCGSESELGERTKEALKKFQTQYELQVTGEPDEATKSKLQELSK
jgi:hypothetical protein